MSRVVPVFINSVRVDVHDDITILDAIRVWRAEVAQQIEEGTHLVTDSRGLPIAPDTPVWGGAIFRILPARAHESEPASELLD